MVWRVLLLGALALTAGCVGLGQSEVTTVTPVAVPSDTPRDAPNPALAPGIPSSDRIDVHSLTSAHRDVILGSSYLWQRRSVTRMQGGASNATIYQYDTLRFENGTTYYRNVSTVQVEDDQRRLYYPTFSEYANGSTYLSRDWILRWQGFRYERGVATNRSMHYANVTERIIRRYLTVETVSITETTIDGERRYRVMSRDIPLVWDKSVTEYSVTAYVRPDGVVTRLRANYTAARGGTIVRTTVEFSYRQIGNVSVTPPEWAIDPQSRPSFEPFGGENDSQALADEFAFDPGQSKSLCASVSYSRPRE